MVRANRHRHRHRRDTGGSCRCHIPVGRRPNNRGLNRAASLRPPPRGGTRDRPRSLSPVASDLESNVLLALLAAAALLSVERLTYVFAWRRPGDFRALCGRLGIGADPVRALERLFYGFKLVQLGVFAGWIVGFAEGWPDFPEPLALIGGGLLVALGQALNLGAFWRLGRVGIFYGVRFGHDVPWCTRFPFSLIQHPQYVGTVLSIWGCFLFWRFPHPDWALIPLLETAYYLLGSALEKEDAASAVAA